MRKLLFFFILLTIYPLHGALTISAGPEIYFMKRFRDGGTWQDGRIDGVKVCLERTPLRYGVYFGADYLYAEGRLKGETVTGRPLVSNLNDKIFEIRGGFTFRSPLKGCPFITPFGGWGNFIEENNFFPPSPIPVKFKDTFNYFVAGFLSGVNFTPLISMGINFKVRFMLNGESQVTDDPVFDSVTLLMQEEIQCRLDVPFTFGPSLDGLSLQIVPFYEFRHFGGREGFPFNFRDTKFHLYGARLGIMYGF